ncbi:MAG: tyrosine--tRNA ligase [Chloroflexota bacterium]
MTAAEKVSIDEQVEVLMAGTAYGDPQMKASMTKDLRERLIQAEKEGRALRVYCGYDPRTSDLHLGHTITMRKLRQFQDFGHDVTFLVGTFTSLIGDPSDKEKARDQLTAEQVDENARSYAEQAFKILDESKTRVRRNDEWLSPLDFADIIRLASNFTVQQFLTRENFSKRIDTGQPIFLHEFFYALMQAYDAVAQEADVQVGGQDQLFNILVAGRKLQEGLGQKPQIAIIMGESLPGTDGDMKMSKSQGNHIPLLGEPYDMFGKVMAVPDRAMHLFHKLLLGWTPSQLEQLEQDMQSNPMEAKFNLAHEIVSIFHSPEDATASRERWDQIYSGDGIPEDIEEETLDGEEERLVQLLKRLNLVNSGKEAKQLMAQGGIQVDQNPVEDSSTVITADMLPVVVQVGKRKFVKLVK